MKTVPGTPNSSNLHIDKWLLSRPDLGVGGEGREVEYWMSSYSPTQTHPHQVPSPSLLGLVLRVGAQEYNPHCYSTIPELVKFQGSYLSSKPVPSIRANKFKLNPVKTDCAVTSCRKPVAWST